MKAYAWVDSEKIDGNFTTTSVVKDMVRNMVQSSLDKKVNLKVINTLQDDTGLLYSSESTHNLSHELKHEVEITSVKLDEVVMEFVRAWLVPLNDS